MIDCRRHLHDREVCFSLLGIFGAFCVGLGRSPGSPIWQLLAALMGYGLIILAMAKSPSKKKSFYIGWSLFSIAFLISSKWLLSHPFSYIIGVWIILSTLFALPYAFVATRFLALPPASPRCIGYAAFFAILEHFFVSLPCGYSFHCAALHLTENRYAIQLSSIIGGLGLSCIVYLTNILFFRAVSPKLPEEAAITFTSSRIMAILPIASSFLLPYAIGGMLYMQRCEASKNAPVFTAAICHFETPPYIDSAYLPPDSFHEREWQRVFQCLLPIAGQKIDLIVLPEGTIPFAADALLYRPFHLPSCLRDGSNGLLSSLDISSKLSSYLKAPIAIGLEGRDHMNVKECKSYNSCFYCNEDGISSRRYDKQLLLPLGEYIPFAFLAKMLSYYGIHSSFTPGKNPVIFPVHNQRLAPLICYEETFSDYACRAYRLHPTILLGLSNDVWYPDARHQHFELTRLRAAELGLPLIRSCNFGISAAVDSLSNPIETMGSQHQNQNGCFIVRIPITSHFSLFAQLGERTIAGILLLIGTFACCYERWFLKRQIFKISKKFLETS